MKPAFVLLCYLAGNPAGQLHLASVNNCVYFKKFLTNQTVKIGEETKTMSVIANLLR